ncbi:Uncharacterised protein [Mycobacteroides abscessus subsp. abscessus]|nr:Uncharacterised protein [Mycobacteroides abscessus subsp. abscessus]
MRVLVGVQPYRHNQLRRAVGTLVAQAVPQRQVLQPGRATDRNGHDRSNLRRTASPCAGRFSALASVITCPATSLSAASV